MSSNKWLSDNTMVDETCMLLNEMAKRCKKCDRAIDIEHLDENQICPDCREK